MCVCMYVCIYSVAFTRELLVWLRGPRLDSGETQLLAGSATPKEAVVDGVLAMPTGP